MDKQQGDPTPICFHDASLTSCGKNALHRLSLESPSDSWWCRVFLELLGETWCNPHFSTRRFHVEHTRMSTFRTTAAYVGFKNKTLFGKKLTKQKTNKPKGSKNPAGLHFHVWTSDLSSRPSAAYFVLTFLWSRHLSEHQHFVCAQIPRIIRINKNQMLFSRQGKKKNTAHL